MARRPDDFRSKQEEERKAMRRFPALPWLLGLAVLVCGAGWAYTQLNQPPQPTKDEVVRKEKATPPAVADNPGGKPGNLDKGKGEIELPLKALVQGKSGPAAGAGNNPNVAAPRLDMGKGMIEMPLKLLVKEKTNPQVATDNPKVEPGKVKWHPSFVAAMEAARKSRKPILLFQMMGKLDDQFC
jgi:hypothetical protein